MVYIRPYINTFYHILCCFESLVGVKRGEPLSPILFVLFLNYLFTEFNKGTNTDNHELIDIFQKFMVCFCCDTIILSESVSQLQIVVDLLSLTLYIYLAFVAFIAE